jgi:hypothetical protein
LEGVMMRESRATTELLEAAAKVLLRCTVFGFLFVLVWVAAYLFAHDMIQQQGGWFGLTAHELGIIHYCGIAFVKGCVLLFFLFPYVAIRLVLRKAANPSDEE